MHFLGVIGVLLLGSFLSVGPTVRIASVHRFAIFLLPAGPPTPQWANLPLANTPRTPDGKPNLTALHDEIVINERILDRKYE